MRTAIIGAGPAGLLLGSALARRGHDVTVVDRDPGPRPDGSWPRKGVMQFDHAHAIRPQAVEAVRREAPQGYERMLAAGAELATMRLPNGNELLLGMKIRRRTFEGALRAAATATPGLVIRVGHVDNVSAVGGRATGLRVDGSLIPAELVIDASGRSGRVTRGLRAQPLAGGTCGIAYVDRQFQLREGAEAGPLTNPIVWQATFDGYQVTVFVHERGIFSVLIIRPTDIHDLVGLRHEAAFSAACRAIPGLADWTDPKRSRPLTPVLAGGTLMNYYRSQRGPHGGLALPGLLFVGDSVCTTTPSFGRGIALSLMQVTEAVRLIDHYEGDYLSIGEEFDTWCELNMLPWVQDHVRMDEAMRQRWSGRDIDLTQRIPSDLIMAAATVNPAIGKALPPYVTMSGLPSSLDHVEPLAHAVYAGGWRPDLPPGPSRIELAEIVAKSVQAGRMVA